MQPTVLSGLLQPLDNARVAFTKSSDPQAVICFLLSEFVDFAKNCDKIFVDVLFAIAEISGNRIL
jgi:hypothetical protein